MLTPSTDLCDVCHYHQMQVTNTGHLDEVCLFVCGGSLTSGQLVKGSFQSAEKKAWPISMLQKQRDSIITDKLMMSKWMTM